VIPDVGTELVNPKAGTRTVFTVTAQSTDGGYVEIDATYPPGAPAPPRHLHPSQEEHFTVLSGRMTVSRVAADAAGSITGWRRRQSDVSVPPRAAFIEAGLLNGRPAEGSRRVLASTCYSST
jgi:hypothetical protein